MGYEGTEQAIIETVRPAGSMTISSIVDSVDRPEKELKLTIVDLISDGILKEHPEFDGAYVVNEKEANSITLE